MYLSGLSSTINIPFFAYGSTANFRFRGPIALLNISNYGNCSGPRIIEICPVIRKLSQLSQVLGEREQTLENMSEYWGTCLIAGKISILMIFMLISTIGIL